MSRGRRADFDHFSASHELRTALSLELRRAALFMKIASGIRYLTRMAHSGVTPLKKNAAALTAAFNLEQMRDLLRH